MSAPRCPGLVWRGGHLMFKSLDVWVSSLSWQLLLQILTRAIHNFQCSIKTFLWPWTCLRLSDDRTFLFLQSGQFLFCQTFYSTANIFLFIMFLYLERMSSYNTYFVWRQRTGKKYLLRYIIQLYFTIIFTFLNSHSMLFIVHCMFDSTLNL